MPKLGDFKYTYIVHHNFSQAEPCVYDDRGKEICSLETTFVDGYILIEEHKCCCRSGYCAVILYDQSEMLLPLMKTVVDLSEIAPIANTGKVLQRATKSHRKNNRVRRIPVSSEKRSTAWTPRIPQGANIEANGSNPPILLVIPFFLIIIFLFCAVGFFNICRDELMDELHSSGIDVIRSEEGGVKQAPREYEY